MTLQSTFASLCGAALIAAGGLYAGPAQAVPVALELALLVDVSGSIDGDEYDLQKQGYINAFRNANVQNAIAGQSGGIAVTYIEWSGSGQQAQLVGWTHLTDAASADAFADALGLTSRAFSGQTNPDAAINYAVPLFDDNDFEGLRLVIDVSGDGTGNANNTAAARDAALAAGINAINGLAIGGTGLEDWYNDYLRGGAGSFVIGVADFEDFEGAVMTKLQREITGSVPEPGTLMLLGLATAALAFSRRRMG
ncbi:MAG TPA: DUF1194 domain-containing protein [Burkholderiales bacterium]|nr:DUF1194 domain-containing protein [Burkholderiales bacterium]